MIRSWRMRAITKRAADGSRRVAYVVRRREVSFARLIMLEEFAAARRKRC
jgi:hypothetical protein